MNFTLKHFLIRKYRGSYKPFDLSFDAAILENLSFVVFAVIYQFQEGISFDTSAEINKWLAGSISGFFYTVTRIGTAIAVAEGPAGPA